MRDKADEFFKKQYYDFIQQVKTADTSEQAAEYTMQLATALYSIRDEHDRSVRATRCMTEAVLSLRSVTERCPQARELFATLKDDEDTKAQLTKQLEGAVHGHKKS